MRTRDRSGFRPSWRSVPTEFCTGGFHPPAGQYELRGGGVTLTVNKLGPDGKPISHPPAPSKVQALAELAELDPLLEDALIYFGRPLDWFDIYKALECLMLKFGEEAGLKSLEWVSASEIIRLKRTANASRHARKRDEPPPNPMGIKEAHALLGVLIRRAFDAVSIEDKT